MATNDLTDDNEGQQAVEWVKKSGKLSDYEWQQVTTSDNEWQQSTKNANGLMSDSKWQRVIKRMKTNGSK